MVIARMLRPAILAACCAMSSASVVVAQTGMPATPNTTSQQAEGVTNAQPSIQTSLGKAGDPGGLRAFLEAKGINYNFTYIGEVLGNASGGTKRGATYQGRLDGQLDVDFEKLADLKGFAGHAQFFQIHGRGLSGNNTQDLFTTSGIEAFPTTLLYEAWLEKKLADGKLFVRAGQLAADTEFFISQTATLFVNATFGWPGSYANDLPSGGPAFPLATPGIRLKAAPTDRLTLLLGLFNGDPSGSRLFSADPYSNQIGDHNGTAFRVKDPPLLIGEAQYAYNQDKTADGLPGTIKVGYFHHFGEFPAYDQFTNPAPATYRGNDSVYGVIDQALYRKPGTDDQGASAFLRVTGAPSDRNLIDLYLDAGIAYKGLIPGRPDDTFGIAGGYGRISPSVSQGDVANGAAPLVRDFEAVIEVTYQYTVVPGFSLQPDFQYLIHPSAHGVADPANGRPIKDAAVFGLRTTIHY